MKPAGDLRTGAAGWMRGEISAEELLSQAEAEADAALLRSVAEELTPHPEVSIPLYRRALEIEPENAETLADLGFVHWLCGEDDEARRCLAQAYRLDPGLIKALLLDAALEEDSGRKRQLYESVLLKDPENQVAIANLKALDGLA